MPRVATCLTACRTPFRDSRAISSFRAIRRARRWCRTAWRSCSTILRYGATPRVLPGTHVHGASCLGATTRDVKPGDAAEAGEALAGRVIEMMRAAGIPNGLSGLGFGVGDVEALAAGAEPQWRVIRNAPKDVSARSEGLVQFGDAVLVAAPRDRQIGMSSMRRPRREPAARASPRLHKLALRWLSASRDNSMPSLRSASARRSVAGKTTSI